MNTKFKIGDFVWVPYFNSNTYVQVPCGVCYGKKVVTLILGNGDSVELPCGYCAKGYDSPTGWEVEYRPKSEPKQIRIAGMKVEVTEKGEIVEYWSGPENCHYVYSEDKVFATREEAGAKGEGLMAEWLANQQKADYIKHDKKKNFVWNAGYHLRKIKQCEKEIEYHKEKAKLCKKRSNKIKPEKGTVV